MKREIELKFVVDTKFINFAEVEYELAQLFRYRSMKSGQSSDYYFRTPEGSRADFVRVRDEGGFSTVCMKVSDKGIAQDRLEEEFATVEPAKAVGFFREVLGPEVGVIHKCYTEFKLHDSADTLVSCCTASGVEGIIVEVESVSMELCKEIAEYVGTRLDLKEEKRSLFQMRFGK